RGSGIVLLFHTGSGIVSPHLENDSRPPVENGNDSRPLVEKCWPARRREELRQFSLRAVSNYRNDSRPPVDRGSVRGNDSRPPSLPQRRRQVALRVLEVRVDHQRAAEFLYRLLQPASAAERDPEVVVRFDEIGFQPQRFPKLADRVVE